MNRVLCIVILIGALISPAVSQTAADLFDQANEHYRSGRFEEAARMYESIRAQGWTSAPLFYNLGNAYYRLGRIAPAMLSYERALKLDPSDADTKHNLRLLSLRTIDRIEPVPELFLVEWIREAGTFLSPSSAGVLFLGSWIVFFVALSSLYLVASALLMRIFRITAFAAFVVVLLSGASLLLNRWADASEDSAIITESTVTVKSSPDGQSVDAFVVHEGLKVRITDAVGDWTRITLPDGKVGWVLKNAAERI